MESANKRYIGITIAIVIALILCLVYYLTEPIILNYDQICDEIEIEIIDEYFCITYTKPVLEVNYLAKSGGTQYIGMSQDNLGRLYKQCFQAKTNRWNQIFGKKKSVLYKNKLGSYGASSGESTIIEDDLSTRIVPRYDAIIYYRDSDGSEHLLWTFEKGGTS